MISVKKISKVAVTMVFVGAPFALGADEPEYVPGMVIVKFKEVLFNAGKNPLETQYNTINTLNEEYGVYNIEPGFKYLPEKPIDDPHGKWKWHHWLEILEKFQYETYYVLKYRNKAKPPEVAEEYAKDNNVDLASPNYIFKLEAKTERKSSYDFLPNDYLFPAQWNLYNYGQTGGIYGADINAPTGWEYWPVPFWEPWVAVIDTGVDLEHYDLKWNLVGGINIITGGVPWDHDGHGTHISGIIAAHTNNNRGVAGIGRDDLIKVMPVCTFEDGLVDDWACANGILWACHQGADVISISWGTLSIDPSVFPMVRKAIEGAYAMGVATCASKGNDHYMCMPPPGLCHYPSDLPEVFGIGATDHNDEKADFSNYGYGTECVAPGVNILSTYIYTNEYDYMSGTSMAAPHAAAICALITASFEDVIDPPSARVEEIRYILIRSCDDLYSEGWDVWTGWGRVNLANVMQIITDSGGDVMSPGPRATSDYWNPETTDPEILTNENEARPVFKLYPVYPNPAKEYLNFLFDLPSAENRVSVSVYDLAGRRIFTQIGPMPQGRNEVYWDFRAKSERLPAGVYVYEVKAGDDVGAGKFVISE